jgi:hypothetical protein
MCRSRVSLALLALLALACDGTGGDPAGADAGATDAGAPGAPDADIGSPDAAPGVFTEIIGRDWSLPPGTELYRCTRVTATEDMFIGRFRALSPLGTHHTVLSVNDTPAGPDGDYDCNASSLAHNMLFASGVGSDELSFPEGVAIKVAAGQQLDLNLHLFNVSDAQLTGHSGTEVAVVPAQDVVHEAEFVFGGTFNIFLPSNPTTEQTITGGCAFTADATVITVWPHMHQIGRHMKVVYQAPGGDVTLHDESYDFNEQISWPIDATEVKAGERIEIACTYLNDTGSTRTFGDSSNDEMCFAGLYRYPATGAGLFECVE